MSLAIGAVASVLQEIPRSELTTELVGPLLKRIDRKSLRPYVHFQPARYTRNLVYRNADFELLVLCWNEFSTSPIHDHDGQRCWFVVHSGAMQVVDYTLVEGGSQPGYALVAPEGPAKYLSAGASDFRNEGSQLHSVGAAAGLTAVSIHLYSRPLDHCMIFNRRTNLCERVALRYDTGFVAA